jgi:hypothetical protein
MTASEDDKQGQPKLPDGIEEISWDNLRRLGIDRDNHLYWDGRQVQTRSQMGFTFWQKAGAFLVVLGALGALVQGIDAGYDFGCKLHWWTQGCSQ